MNNEWYEVEAHRLTIRTWECPGDESCDPCDKMFATAMRRAAARELRKWANDWIEGGGGQAAASDAYARADVLEKGAEDA